MSRDDIYYAAMRARDARFDGKFFVGVKTTGIYCRPICPARPKRENVEFFTHRLQAERAGYRPCLRCHPESAPQSPVWIGKSAIVKRALKRLGGVEGMDLDEERFAGLFGVTARHLRRVFQSEIGKTPKQLFFENRLNLARQLILETALPLSEIAFASGFRSIRRFNDAFRARFARSPREIRRRALPDGAPLSLTLPYRPPFDFRGLLAFYRSHLTGNLEWIENETFYRVIEKNGKTGVIAVSHEPDHARVRVTIEFPDASVLFEVVAQVRALFDLDSDPVLIANAVEGDLALKKILKKHAGIRLPSGWSGFEIAIAAILGQLVSVPRGRALVGQLIALLGEDSGRTRNGERIRLFPAPEKIAASSLDGVGTTRMRKRTLIEFSRAVARGELSLEPTQDVDDFRAAVLKIPGIGPWTADYLALKVLRHTDAFPATDLILARALVHHPASVIEQMSPWRGYVAALLWREYSETLKKKRGKT